MALRIPKVGATVRVDGRVGTVIFLLSSQFGISLLARGGLTSIHLYNSGWKYAKEEE